MDKKTTDMNLTDLGKAIPGMSDDELRAAWLAETETEGHKARAGAVEAIKDEAEKRGELEAMTRPSDGSGETETTEKAPETPAEREARLRNAADDALMAQIEADPRKALLTIHRGMEFIANHLNLRLPS